MRRLLMPAARWFGWFGSSSMISESGVGEMSTRLKSRKFWISVAAFLGSLAASIAGVVTEEKWITITGVVCGMLSAAIYSALEASIDRAAVKS